MKFTVILAALTALYVQTMVCIHTCYAQAAEDTGGRTAIAITRDAIQESLDGKTADWKEQVSDEQYRSDPAP